MYRHPFANPEHVYGRMGSSMSYDDRRPSSPLAGPYRSFVPMASQSTFFDGKQTPRQPSRSPHRRAQSPRRLRFQWNKQDEDDEQVIVIPAWRRALDRMRRRARRSLQRVRTMLQATRSR